jgi:hypothetical protein
MKIDDAERLLIPPLKVTDSQRLASAYLESIGSRFCIEHGIENCEWLADEAVMAVTGGKQ